MLEMKKACEQCHIALDSSGEAYICSYECTFCNDCTRHFDAACPNCSAELLRRPRREPALKTPSQKTGD